MAGLHSERMDRGVTMHMLMRFRALALVMAIALALQACASAQRVDQASEVAKEGVELTRILPAFYDEYYKSAIRADSVTLELLRQEPGITTARLRTQLQEANTDLQQTGALLRGMKEHVALLQEYFEAIAALTDGKVGDDFGSATKALIEGMVSVRDALPDRNPLDISVEKAGKPAGNFVVVALKDKALRKELEAHGAAIDSELAIQEELLKKLGESMTSNQQAWATAGLETPLFETYESKKQNLPWTWTDRRVEFLTLPADSATAMKAEEAMAELRLAWRELAGGGPKKSTLMRLQNRIDATQKLVAALAN